MTATLHSLTTALPPHAYTQTYILNRMQSWLDTDHLRRKAAAIYKRSGIQTRHSVLPDFQPDQGPLLFHEKGSRPGKPSTGDRNAVYQSTAVDLIDQLGRRLLARRDVHPQQITHLIFVTCTGFSNPGPEVHLMRTMGLRAEVQRLCLGFMGCQAALPALRTAHDIVAADPTAQVLLVCLELCTLHFQIDDSDDTLMANAIFADGAAAGIVSSPPPDAAHFELHQHNSLLLNEGASDMAWTIGDHGFDLRLSTYVPDILGRTVPACLADETADAWAVHPGGRRILDHLERGLALPPGALDVSRDILKNYGNMSSATILFVLAETLKRVQIDQSVLAMAFGPGLTLETARMTARVTESALAE